MFANHATTSQSQLIAPSCRPTYKGQQYQSKKTDFALAFCDEHPEVSQKYDELGSFLKRPALSQMNSISTSKMAFYHGGEVKTPRGSRIEAQAQLFYWLGTGIIRMRKLVEKIGRGTLATDDLMPLLGRTIVGHTWEFYIAFGVSNKFHDEIHILGPVEALSCSISSWHNTFKLLQLEERIKDWARRVYWPWYCRAIIDPLKRVIDLPKTQEEVLDEAQDDAEREQV